MPGFLHLCFLNFFVKTLRLEKIKDEEADIRKRVDNIGENVKRNRFGNIFDTKSLRTDLVWIQISIHTI